MIMRAHCGFVTELGKHQFLKLWPTEIMLTITTDDDKAVWLTDGVAIMKNMPEIVMKKISLKTIVISLFLTKDWLFPKSFHNFELLLMDL